MTVKNAIKHLQKMPPNARLFKLENSHVTTEINEIYLSQDGRAVAAGSKEHVMNTEERPQNAPTWEQDSFWTT